MQLEPWIPPYVYFDWWFSFKVTVILCFMAKTVTLTSLWHHRKVDGGRFQSPDLQSSQRFMIVNYAMSTMLCMCWKEKITYLYQLLMSLVWISLVPWFQMVTIMPPEYIWEADNIMSGFSNLLWLASAEHCSQLIACTHSPIILRSYWKWVLQL
jgi:hypothetical protein